MGTSAAQIALQADPVQHSRYFHFLSIGQRRRDVKRPQSFSNFETKRTKSADTQTL